MRVFSMDPDNRLVVFASEQEVPEGASECFRNEQELAEVVLLSSLADETPEGRSIVQLAEDEAAEIIGDQEVPRQAVLRARLEAGDRL